VNETPTNLTVALQQIYGPRDSWPLFVAAAHAQLTMVKELAPGVYEPALCCAVEAIYNEAAQPTRWDFLGWQRQRTFERRFGVERDPEVDLAFAVCRGLSDLLGPQQYQRIMSAAWEASRFETRKTVR
jgi:hypothetical protein